MAKRFRVVSPAFRTPGGGRPCFIAPRQLAWIGTRGLEVWSLDSRTRLQRVKLVKQSMSFVRVPDSDQVVSKNAAGVLGYSSLANGALTRKTKRPPYQDGANIAMWLDGEHLIDASSDGDIFVHAINSGEIVQRESMGALLASAGVAVSRSAQSVWIAFNASWGNSCFAGDKGSLWRFAWPLRPGAGVEVRFHTRIQRISVAPDGWRVAVVLERETLHQAASLALLDSEGRLLKTVELPGRDVYFAPPAWSPDGCEIALVLDRRQILFLDAATLEVVERAQGPYLTGVAYAPEGGMFVILGDDFGLVLPRSDVGAWSRAEGQPAAELAEAKFLAYTRRIDLRKAITPRVAVFRTATAVLVEAERMMGMFRYLSRAEVESLDPPVEAEHLGAAILRGLDRFKGEPVFAGPIMGPAFAGESDQLRELGVLDAELDRVRYLGHSIPFVSGHAGASAYVSVCRLDGLIDLWPGIRCADGRFAETDWPRLVLGQHASAEQVGEAALAALEQSRTLS
jgi:hypothetical protein